MESPENTPLPIIEFTSNNPHAAVRRENLQLIVEKPWGIPEIEFAIPQSDSETIRDLGYILINPQLDALLHLDSNEAEFLFAFLDPNDERSQGFQNRRFKFHHQGVEYDCAFRKPTDRLFRLARYLQRLPTERSMVAAGQLIQFRDSQQLERLPQAAKDYFAKRTQPRSFFIQSSCPLKEVVWDDVSRHLNLVMRYFDRKSPIIVLRQPENEENVSDPKHIRYIEDSFPTEISSLQADEVLLSLLEVARGSEVRSAFIYCYQIFEYAGFHFIDWKTKSALLKIVRSPSFISRADDKIGELFSVLTEAAQNDEVRIRKAIDELCEPQALWREIESNRSFFTEDIEFDGGFTLQRLIGKDTTFDSWSPTWSSAFFERATRIRNCLVHAREKRENRVIMPGRVNDARILQYLPLMIRAAEQIVLNSAKFS
ncbi:MAG: hypothetical protein KF715_15365 [Candidatus Didemnitutus sp.]|nr:hypothetical protein [Candidatus Didemnitutus sp.]